MYVDISYGTRTSDQPFCCKSSAVHFSISEMLTRQRRNGNGKRVAGTRVPQKPKAPSMFDCIILDDGVGEEKPAPRSGHRIVADDGNIYCFGGYNPLGYGRQYRHGLFPEIWRFSLAKRRWHLIQSEGCPEETASHSMVLWR